MAAQYEKLLADMGNADALNHDDGGIAGLHQTDTVDIVTIISGEVYAVLETGETLLRQGDSIVTRGTKHGWSNRSDKPCTLFNIMWGAVR
jgi:quercetin dioxygenase-like cupin family protein